MASKLSKEEARQLLLRKQRGLRRAGKDERWIESHKRAFLKTDKQLRGESNGSA